MAVNRDKTDRWEQDIRDSRDFYNSWFLGFAPRTFRETRIKTEKDVKEALRLTDNLTNINPALLGDNPKILPTLRMTTCPPIARDRLIGLSGAQKNLVLAMEKFGRVPPRMNTDELAGSLSKIVDTIRLMVDRDLFVWLGRKEPPTDKELARASAVVIDRLCGAESDPLIRNEQESRQLDVLRRWLESREYREWTGKETKTKEGRVKHVENMPAGTFAFRTNVRGILENGASVNIPVDAVIMLHGADPSDMPLLFEAKSAGDATNTNKRRKEESDKKKRLVKAYGEKAIYILFLCGYFETAYLGHTASENIDWVWEHRIDDLAEFGL